MYLQNKRNHFKIIFSIAKANSIIFSVESDGNIICEDEEGFILFIYKKWYLLDGVCLSWRNLTIFNIKCWSDRSMLPLKHSMMLKTRLANIWQFYGLTFLIQSFLENNFFDTQCDLQCLSFFLTTQRVLLTIINIKTKSSFYFANSYIDYIPLLL